MTAPRQTVALVRVSTTQQDGMSQRQAIERFAAEKGLAIDEWVDEGNISGALPDTKRPKLHALMARVDAGQIAAVLVTEWSRLGRDVLAQLERALRLQRKGVRVLALDDLRTYDLDDPDDLLVFFLLCWKDHRARIDTKKRTARALEGWEKDGQRVPAGTPGAVRVSVRNGRKVGTPGLSWSPDADAELLRRRECGQTIAQIASLEIPGVTRLRAVDAKGRLVSESKAEAVGFQPFPVSRLTGSSVHRRLRELAKR